MAKKKNKKKTINELIKDINYEFSQSKNIIIIPISTLNKKDILFLKNKIRELILEMNKNVSLVNYGKTYERLF